MDKGINLKRLNDFVRSRMRDVIIGEGIAFPWVPENLVMEWGIIFHRAPEMTMGELTAAVEEALTYRDSFGTQADDFTPVRVMNAEGEIFPMTERMLSQMMATARRI